MTILKNKIFIMIFATVFISSCASHVEDRASLDFEPIIPENMNIPNNNSNSGGIYNESSGGLFATDRRAGQVGDILTIALSEDFTASKSQSATSAKSDSFKVDLPNLLDPAGDQALLDSGAETSFSGTGSAAQTNSLRGEISVTVMRVFSNGNMEIMGQKKLHLNNGNEYVRLSGMIRPQDISANNVVQSSRIANAKIAYLGVGDIADTGQKGWLSRALASISPL
ncbi:MAG: flagellar biosynthesis protein FlgH [Rhodobacteraceae bacterium]|nr:MAG: flagellar biosynthesis protein FlgH [Paracoccaceae bacterium]